MEPILRTEHLTFTYPGEEHPSLGDLSLEIARGSFVACLLYPSDAADEKRGVGIGGRVDM